MNSRNFGIGAGIAGIGSGLAGLFGGGGKDPYDAAKGYLNKIPGTISPYFNPYIDAGRAALGQVQGQFGNLINDPSAMYNKIAGGYHQSPGFQWQLGQGMNAAGNAAAAGGLAGSPAHQQQAATMAEGLANQDFQNYMSQALGLYGTGLSGMQGINAMGYGASNELAGGLANNLMNQANLAFAGQAAKNQSRGSSWGNIFGGIGSLLGGLF